MVDESNKLVKLFRMVKDRFKNSEIPSMKLRLIGRRYTDSNQYDLPTSNNIGALIVGDIGECELGRDIVIQNKTDNL